MRPTSSKSRVNGSRNLGGKSSSKVLAPVIEVDQNVVDKERNNQKVECIRRRGDDSA